MKKLLLILALLLTLNVGKAEIISTNLAASTNHSVVFGPLELLQVVAANNSTNAINLYLYDAPSTNLTYTNAAYTITTLSAAVNVIKTYTNFYGRTNSWTNYVMTNITTVVAASTNNYLLISSLAVPAGTTVTYTPAQSVPVNRGILATNSNTNITITAVISRTSP